MSTNGADIDYGSTGTAVVFLSEALFVGFDVVSERVFIHVRNSVFNTFDIS